jgi:hypothetical protein
MLSGKHRSRGVPCAISHIQDLTPKIRKRGIAMDVRAAVAIAAGKPLEVTTVQLDGPREG